MNRQEIKSMAKEQIKGKIGIIFLINLIIVAIIIAANFTIGLIPFVGSLVVAIFINPAFVLSQTKVYLGLTQNKSPEAGDAFTGFYDFWTAFKVGFFQGLFTFLWSLLFVVPGIIKYFSYSMAMYIVAENPGMSSLEAISRSKEMMNGRKMDLFVLGLSFIGWILLGYITFGIAYIWVIPYMSTTYANFYNKVKGERYFINTINSNGTLNSDSATML